MAISSFKDIEKNEIINQFLLARHKFMPEIHLRQPGFTCSAFGTFTKNKEIIQKFKETRDSRYIYQGERDKNCFSDHLAYGDFKDLLRKQLLIRHYLIDI